MSSRTTHPNILLPDADPMFAFNYGGLRIIIEPSIPRLSLSTANGFHYKTCDPHLLDANVDDIEMFIKGNSTLWFGDAELKITYDASRAENAELTIDVNTQYGNMYESICVSNVAFNLLNLWRRWDEMKAHAPTQQASTICSTTSGVF